MILYKGRDGELVSNLVASHSFLYARLRRTMVEIKHPSMDVPGPRPSNLSWASSRSDPIKMQRARGVATPGQTFGESNRLPPMMLEIPVHRSVLEELCPEDSEILKLES